MSLIRMGGQFSTAATGGAGDKLGITGSTVCIIHCALTPLLLVLAPYSELSFLKGEAVDRSLAVLVIAIALLVFIPSFKLHRKISILIPAALGVLSLLFAAFGVDAVLPEHLQKSGDTAFTVIGGGLIVLTHLMNRSFCKSCKTCCENGACAH